MQAFRREIFGKLALLALATQLVLSFGHVHLHEQHTPAATSPASCDNKTPAPANAPGPAHDDDDEQHCSICWTIAIAGSIVLAAPPVLEVPRVTLAPPRPPIVVGQLGETSTVKFQARGPPLA
jgi:hypothetical protein